MADVATSSPASGIVPSKPAPGRHRPFGLFVIITLLILQVLLGALVVILGVLSVVVQSATEFVGTIMANPLAPVDTLLVPLWALVVVVGLWRYHRWAWYMMMLLLAYWMATDAINYFNAAPDYFPMLLNVAMVFYLNQREVQQLFVSRSGTEEEA